MAATVRINERNGEAPGTLTNGITNLNFGNIDAANLQYASYPVRRGYNSYDKWIKLEWYTGSANKLSSFKFWRSDSEGGSGAALPSGLSIVCEAGVGSDLVYTTPSTEPIDADECPNTEAGALSVGPTELIGPGSTYYVHLQAQTTSQASTGDQPTMYFSFSYLEE